MMKKNVPTSTETKPQEPGLASRQVYETPELIIYNQSAITMGGIKKPKAHDIVGGGTTSYFS